MDDIYSKKPEECAYSFTQHRACEFFPCHKTSHPEDFNCLFCYCPLYTLGSKCGDQNNPDIYKKPMIGKALCLPQTIGSTTGGMVLFTVCSHGKQPACMLFSLPIDSLAASGAILGDVWTDSKMPVVDSLGDEFLQYVQTGMTVTVGDDGLVTVED